MIVLTIKFFAVILMLLDIFETNCCAYAKKHPQIKLKPKNIETELRKTKGMYDNILSSLFSYFNHKTQTVVIFTVFGVIFCIGCCYFCRKVCPETPSLRSMNLDEVTWTNIREIRTTVEHKAETLEVRRLASCTREALSTYPLLCISGADSGEHHKERPLSLQ